MTIFSIISELEKIAPPVYQESYDNVGLLTGDANRTCTGVLCTLDTTETIIHEAVQKRCNLIVSHHPIIFGGLKSITGKDYVEKTVIAAIKNDIAIYAIHTNLDNQITGVNSKIADKVRLCERRILLPKNLPEKENIGSGLIGKLPEAMSETAFLTLICRQFNVPVIKHTPLLGRDVRKVALCGGAGSFLIGNAIAAGADMYITADVKYHDFFNANDKMVIADIGHWESEQFTIELLVDILRTKLPTFALLKSEAKTNPVNYFISDNNKAVRNS